MVDTVKQSVQAYLSEMKEAAETQKTSTIVKVMTPIALTVIAIYALKIKVWSPEPKKRITRRRSYRMPTRRRRRTRRRR